MSSPTSSTINTQVLGSMIRSWVHFDNLAATFARQTQQARSARARWEEQIISNLRENKMINAIIQITGGKLSVHEEKHANPLTLQRLEALLHDYYGKKTPGSDDETSDIMAFIKANRVSSIECRINKS